MLGLKLRVNVTQRLGLSLAPGFMRQSIVMTRSCPVGCERGSGPERS